MAHPSTPDRRLLDDATLAELVAIVRHWRELLGDADTAAALPARDAVDQLLNHLGDDAPVDDFEAGRCRDRRRLPRIGIRRG
jgi:hypothetical protein